MKYVYIVISLLLLSACLSGKDMSKVKRLKVDLKEQNVSVSDLFKKIEAIPLETTGSCLIIMPQKVSIADDKSFFLEKTSENIKKQPLHFANDYIICLVPYEEYDSYKSILDADEYKKLSSRTEDDNLCLINFYFK